MLYMHKTLSENPKNLHLVCAWTKPSTYANVIPLVGYIVVMWHVCR